ncbi:MAG: bifunctional metallophosphatase/5'-nucleotidase, partial [Novosphingobium sp.]
MLKRLIPAFLASILLAGCATGPQSAGSSAIAPRTVTIGIAAINDFHGNLEPPKQSAFVKNAAGELVAVPVGGAAYLASAIDTVRAKYPQHLTISAGDVMGSAPLTSALFLDEPSITVMNKMGLDFNAVGNHEFDFGVPELLRKQSGGCAKYTERQPCQLEKFAGAKFRFLAANTFSGGGKTLFPGTAMRSFGTGKNQVKIGLIGMTLKGTSDLVPTSVNKLVSFTDVADTANPLVEMLKAQGADAVILVVHEGGRTTGEPNANGCQGLSGGIKPILEKLDTRVDLVISGHTHWSYVCDYAQYNAAKPFLLTSAGLWGEYVTDIALEIDPEQHKVVAKRAHNVIVQSEPYVRTAGPVPNSDLVPLFAPRADISAVIAKYKAASQSYVERKVGWLAAPLPKEQGPAWGTGGPLGNLIADAQLAATAKVGAEIAFTNPFGIRRSLTPAADHSVSFGDLYLVQPFSSELITMTLTGADIKQAMEQQLDNDAPEQILSSSAGFRISYDRGKPIGSKIVSMELNGVPIDMAKDYRVTVNVYLANGGDSFTAFLKGRDLVIGVTDIAALEAWLKPNDPPRAGSPEQR